MSFIINANKTLKDQIDKQLLEEYKEFPQADFEFRGNLTDLFEIIVGMKDVGLFGKKIDRIKIVNLFSHVFNVNLNDNSLWHSLKHRYENNPERTKQNSILYKMFLAVQSKFEL